MFLIIDQFFCLNIHAHQRLNAIPTLLLLNLASIKWSYGELVVEEIHLAKEKHQEPSFLVLINIKKKLKFKLYIGGKGTNGICGLSVPGGFNGGGRGGFSASGGGGSTDIRLNDKLSSRIIVAAGASGGERTADGHGGGLNGVKGSLECSLAENAGSSPGTQNSGGIGCRKVN